MVRLLLVWWFDPSGAGVRFGLVLVHGVVRRGRRGGGRWRYASADSCAAPGLRRRGWDGSSRPRRTSVAVRSAPRSGSPMTSTSGVKHSSTRLLAAQAADLDAFVRGQVVHDDVDRCPVRAGRPDRFQCREGVSSGFTLPDDAAEGVVTDAVAAVELPDAVEFVIVRRAAGPGVVDRVQAAPRWGRIVSGPNSSNANTRSGKRVGDLLDAGEFRLDVRVVGLLPGLGPLEG